MAQTKQAKTLSRQQIKAILSRLDETRYPERDRVRFLLSIKAGMRAKEIAALTWSMVTNSEGNISEAIELHNDASKGKKGGRAIPMHTDLMKALATLQAIRGDKAHPNWPVVYSERMGHKGLSAASITVWFHRLYSDLGMQGCSSHSGRRTFVTNAARKITEAGGSLRDVQQLAGHSSIQTTQLYIEGSTNAKKKVIALL